MARLLPADLAARAAGVQPSTLRDWRRRGLITPAGGSERRPLYDVQQLYAAQQASKPRRTAQRVA